MTPVFSDEVMLAGWQETHTGGAKVTFWLQSSEALDVFRGMTAKKGNTAGQRMACVLVLINDDETPITPAENSRPKLDRAEEERTPQAQGVETPAGNSKPGPLCMLAVRWCAMPEFWAWLCENEEVPATAAASVGEAFAKEWMLMRCYVGSRRDLDHNTAAGMLFNDLIRRPFMAWASENEVALA